MANSLPYREIEEIGRGGMAAVYRAENIQTGTEAALKRPMPWDGCNDRLRREADSLSSIEHPHVMPVLDTGTDTDGNHWYAVGSLDKLWAKGFLGTDAEARRSSG